ncbi:MAG: M55 family metallopeptidase [Clostridia bacterium]|nr:M55 family metallopeptidase [Clostridia bacterium]
MYKRILLALDLEGVNNVKGVPYEALSKDTDEWKIAKSQAALEINAAADALFRAGAERVDLWDNHGGGHNIDPADLDPRIMLLDPDLSKPRMYFADDYDCVCYFGYHAMEGTLGGVLAHTMSSKTVQFYKLNGKYIGEIDMDAYIAASHGKPSVFFAGGNIACSQAKHAVESIVTVITKHEISRNEAEFRDNSELFAEIGKKITEAVNTEHGYKTLDFPARFEKSFKRVEDTAKYLARLQKRGIEAEYLTDEVLGKDAHTVVSTVHNIEEFIVCI